jgi:SAM-dependent methyltransferase
MSIFKKNRLTPEIAEKYIKTLYRVLFSREPDQEGFRNWTAFLQRSGVEGFVQTLASFSESEEFARTSSLTLENNDLEKNGEFHFEYIQDDTISKLFQITANYWRTRASDPEEIYWSVLTNPKFKGKLSPEIKTQFLSSGAGDVQRIRSICKKVGYNIENCKRFLDYGCGVGRLIVNLPAFINEISCVDFSAAHLNEARSNISALNDGKNYSYYTIGSVSDIERLPANQDVIHSCIVLQHNTPPVIERTITNLLNLLATGGLAILHVPIAKTFYSFDVDNYVKDENSGKSMEMHILPKANLYNVAEKCKCEIAFSYCAGGCGGDIYSEFMVFRRK